MHKASLAFAIITLATVSAHADVLHDAGDELGVYYKYVGQLTRSPTSSDELPPDCDGAVARWKAKGVKDDDRIVSYDFNAHPDAKDNAIPMSVMAKVCADYAPLYEVYKLDYDLRQFDSTLLKVRDGFVKPGDGVLTTAEIDRLERTGDAKACKATVVAAAGKNAKLKTNGVSGRLSLADFDAKVCDVLATVMPPFVTEARAKLAANTVAAAAPYRAAGIAGDKLALIVKYDGVEWRLVGGKVTDDPATLAKASVLFQWLEADDPDDARYVVHTIRRYKFKGDALVNQSEKQYRRKAGAPVGNVWK
jgi:hypothetical protein